MPMIAFGPVPSRRLGKSMGINNIPPKACSYSCIYCQVGRTNLMQVEPRDFYEPEQIVQQVEEKVASARAAGERIDALTFVPDGEPTLDRHLGREIALLKPLGITIAVITNSSLLWRPDVRRALAQADWVSVKVDAVQEDIWRRIDRPQHKLQLTTILDGVCDFASTFAGKLITETMLVKDVNDSGQHIEQLANFLVKIDPAVAYLTFPIRPPAEKQVRCPDDAVINQAYQIFSQQLMQVECLTGYEGNAFASTGDVASDLLSITAVHPMRADAVEALLARAGQDWPLVDRLIANDELARVTYNEQTFFTRKLGKKTLASPDDAQ